MDAERIAAHYRALRERLEEATLAASQPDAVLDQPRFQALMKEMADLAPRAESFSAYESTLRQMDEAREMASHPDLRDMAREELDSLEGKRASQLEELRLGLLPRDEDDEGGVVMEIRAGAGGEEAALFGADLLRMYTRYAEAKGFTAKLMSVSESDLGGVKDAALTLSGRGAYSRLKFESGVHVVKRVPQTESQGRLHTSTATVAVLPAREDAQVDIEPGDVRVDVYRSSGHGGQSVNTTDSAVRVTHLPTGLVVTCQNEKSQIKNREEAMRVLRIRLYDLERARRDAEYAARRRGQIGSGERSEKVRTYHFTQGRVTDHRAGITLYQLDTVLEGGLDPLIDALTLFSQREQLGRQEA
ncbi:MAG TPA: peptide chain release factor 1 [Candidatus Limnocylindria bacterium]|nr:peptide chain release factor 1 [Candidatus Limnocylindria bacterium]